MVVAVFGLLVAILGAARAAFRTRASLIAEDLALRQQLAILRAGRRPRLRPVDRAFWVVLSRVWSRWVDVLVIVKPATVVAWHRRGFARFWAYKSRRTGRPPLAGEVVALIARMSQENPTWSRRRIAAELAMLGWKVSKDTVALHMSKPAPVPRKPRATHWATFARLHLTGTIAIDFLTVPPVTFRTLYVFVVLALERRVLLHVNVTAHPHAAWAAQQIVEALGPDAPAVHRLIRDRGWDLRAGIRCPRAEPGYRTASYIAAVTVAKRLRGAPRGNTPPRVARSRCRARRAASALVGPTVRQLLQRRPSAYVAEPRRTERANY
jgi:putative transposase